MRDDGLDGLSDPPARAAAKKIADAGLRQPFLFDELPNRTKALSDRGLDVLRVHLVDGHASNVQIVVPMVWTISHNFAPCNARNWTSGVTGTPGDRLREERKRIQKTQIALAELADVSKNTQLAYETGASPIPMDYLETVAAHGIDTAYVASGRRFPDAIQDRRIEYRAHPLEQTDVVEVAEIDLRYGMGATFLADIVDSTPRSFSRAWLRNFTDSPPTELFWARGQGNSMEPEIRDGDIVLIDRSQRSVLMADLIWAFAYGDTGMIKWLRPMPDGSVKILSSNQSVRPETAHDGEINIIGRVVAVVKRL